LLRKLFTSIYPDLTTSQPIEDLIHNAFAQRGIEDQTLLNFMNYQAPFDNEHIIFEQANLKETTALSIIARSSLLLRISVGLTSKLFKAGGGSKNELSFVWNNYSVDNGFWPEGAPINDFSKLWTDIEFMFDDLTTDINTAGMDNSIYSVRDRNPKEIIHLTQINRACLWGLDF